MLEYKNFGFELSDIREEQDGWTVCGYISTYSTDRKRERVMPGAADKWLKIRHDDALLAGKMSGVRFLWQHDQKEIIGYPTVIRVDSHGIYVESKFIEDCDFPQARKAYKLAKMGLITDFSVGYLVLVESKGNDGLGETRDLNEIDIQEYSLVTVPMQPEAQVTEVKSLEEETVSFEEKTPFDMEEIKALQDEFAKFKEELLKMVSDLTPPRLPIVEEEVSLPVVEEVVEVLQVEAVEPVMVEASAEEQVEQKEVVLIEEPCAEGEDDPEMEQDGMNIPCPHCNEMVNVKVCKVKGCKTEKKSAEVVDTIPVEEAPVEVTPDPDDSVGIKGLLDLALELKTIFCEG
jgi:HK97 family phage prohead protease